MTINTLNHLHSDIYDRVRSISEDNNDWPCRVGCDNCCRRLAEIPQLTMAEWNFLREGLHLLAPEHLHEIIKGVAGTPRITTIKAIFFGHSIDSDTSFGITGRLYYGIIS